MKQLLVLHYVTKSCVIVCYLCFQADEKSDKELKELSKSMSVSTDYFEWCCRHFSQPLMRLAEEEDPESQSHLEREWRFDRNLNVRGDAREEQQRAGKFCLVE